MSTETPITDAALADWHNQGKFHHWNQGDCQIFYRDIGDPGAASDRTVLLLHGFPESSFSFHKVVELLRARFDRIVLVDLPGFGFSDKPERLTYSLIEQTDALMSVWREVGIRGGHLISHDMGDSIACEVIARSVQALLPGWFEDGVLTLTVTNGNMVMEKAKLVPMQKLMRNHWIGPHLSKLVAPDQFSKSIHKSNGAPMEQVDVDRMWQQHVRQDGHRLTWKTIRYLDERDRFQNPRWLRGLSLFKNPIHICWGSADAVAPIAVAEHLKAHVCPGAHLTLIPEAGHFCQLHTPKQWADAVMRTQ